MKALFIFAGLVLLFRPAVAGGNGFLLTAAGAPGPDGGTNLYFYDSRGHISESTFYSSNSLGISTSDATYVCDQQGNTLSGAERDVSDVPANDFFPAITFYRYAANTNFWEHGEIVSMESDVTNFDTYFQHTNISHEVSFQTYNNRGQPLTATSSDYADGSSHATFRQDTEWSYDQGGRLLSIDSTLDINSDGSVDWISHSTFQTDANGRLLTEFNETDLDADGVVDSTSVTVFIYDHWGNDIQELTTVYDANGGVIGSGIWYTSYERRAGIMGNSRVPRVRTPQHQVGNSVRFSLLP